MAIKKSNHLLPADVWIVASNLNSHIKNHRYPELRKKALEVRHAYIIVLRRLGWTLESIAEPFSITRERVRQLSNLPAPNVELPADIPLPTPPEKPVKPKRVPTLPTDQATLDLLKELYAEAKLVRYRQPKHRTEAELFTKLVWQLVSTKQATTYSLAKYLGITTAALDTRLVRYGYRTSPGASRCYTKLIHRKPLEN